MPGVFKIKNLQDAEFTLTHPDGVGAVSIDSNNIAKIDAVNAALALKANTADLKEIGVGQTWQNVTASRLSGTTYTNTTGKPINVIITIEASVYNTYYRAVLTINSNLFATIAGNEGITYAAGTISVIIPNGATYKLDISNGTIYWQELR